ncbi:MAG: nickel-dependent lactate racemase [Christensenellales bacterium]
MNIELGFGKEKLCISVPDQNMRGMLMPNKVEIGLEGVDEVNRAIKAPIGSKRLKDIVNKGENICIITSDITRPMPSKFVIPAVLEELYLAGVLDKDITIVFALGNHRPHTEEEKKHLVGGEIYSKIKCVDSDQSRVIHMGNTSFGTPVDIFETVAKADRVICLGNIEYHYFAGYSGGAKAIMPGVSTAAAIQANHSKMVEDTSAAGRFEGNNVRKDIDEVARFLKIDFIVNVVLDEKKQIIKAVAGHYIEAHREGCSFLDRLYKVRIKQKADIVIVSAGGFPKDINLYQAQKALDNSKHAVKDGGVVILVASCKEGLGEKVFERWMKDAKSPSDMVEKIQRKFELGGHKAAAIGMVQQKADVYLVSDMDKTFVRSLFFEPFDNVQAALDKAFEKLGDNADVIVMPYGGSTLPELAES